MVKMLMLMPWVVIPCGLVGRHVLPSCSKSPHIVATRKINSDVGFACSSHIENVM